MKKLFKTGTVIMMLAAACVGFASCSDDNDETGGFVNPTPGMVNPSNVFTGKLPVNVGGLSIIRNAEGLVSEMRTAEGETIKFDYLYSKAAENHVTMSVIEDGISTDYDLTIGSNGFVTKAYVKIGNSGDKEYEEGTWTMSYDNEGHLTKANHVYVDVYGEEDYTVNLQWKNGNPEKTWKDGEEEDWDSYTYLYTSASYPTLIENKGSLFMFEDVYPVEVYEFEWLYYAGMLGKGPKNLAVAHYENGDEEDVYVTDYVWTLDNNGYPTMFDVKDDDHPGSSTVRFTWN